MEGLASTATTRTLPARRDGEHDIRAEIRRRWEQLHPERSMRVDQLDGLERFTVWLMRAARNDGAEILRPVPQIVRGMGLPATTTRAERQNRGIQIKRYAGYLEQIGWLEGRGAAYKDNREGRGIVLRVTDDLLSWAQRAGVAQLARATGPRRRRGSEPPGGSVFSAGEVSTPYGDHQLSRSPSLPSQSSGTASVRARVAGSGWPSWAERDRREREAASLQRGAALESLRAASIEDAQSNGGWGLGVLREAAAAGADPLTVVLAAWRQTHGEQHPALTSRRREWIVRYCRILDRLERRPGTGAQLLIDAIATAAARQDRIYSLDYFACRLRSHTRATRRRGRGLDPIPREKAGWFEARRQLLGEDAARRADQLWRWRRRRGLC